MTITVGSLFVGLNLLATSTPPRSPWIKELAALGVSMLEPLAGAQGWLTGASASPVLQWGMVLMNSLLWGLALGLLLRVVLSVLRPGAHKPTRQSGV